MLNKKASRRPYVKPHPFFTGYVEAHSTTGPPSPPEKRHGFENVMWLVTSRPPCLVVTAVNKRLVGVRAIFARKCITIIIIGISVCDLGRR